MQRRCETQQQFVTDVLSLHLTVVDEQARRRRDLPDQEKLVLRVIRRVLTCSIPPAIGCFELIGFS